MSRARIPLDAWQAAGRYIDYRGHPIFVRVGGSRNSEALLLIHGFPTESATTRWHTTMATHRPVLLQKLLLSPLGPLVSRLTSRARLATNMQAIFGASTPPDDELIDGFWRLRSHGEGPRIMHKLIRYTVERRQQ